MLSGKTIIRCFPNLAEALDQKIMLKFCNFTKSYLLDGKSVLDKLFFQIELRKVLYKEVMVIDPHDLSGRIPSPSKLGNMKN